MRHRKSGRRLNRNSSHRKAMFRNMARSLLTFERIRTTEAKAKELRGFVDGLITLALKNDLHARRLARRPSWRRAVALLARPPPNSPLSRLAYSSFPCHPREDGKGE